MIPLQVLPDAVTTDAHRGALGGPKLVEAMRRGDERAFAELVRRYSRRLHGMCMRYLHDEHLADDTVQETFLRMLENLARVDDDLNLGPWLHRIATNLCLDELRRHRRAIRWLDSDEDGQESLLFQVIDGDRARQPEHAFDDCVVRDRVRAAASRLPARQLTVLANDLCDVSQADTARALGVSVGAVQGILFRARERFRSEYMELAGTGGLPPECATVAFTLEMVPLRSLRLDRLKALRRHLSECGRTCTRFGELLERAERVTPADAVAV